MLGEGYWQLAVTLDGADIFVNIFLGGRRLEDDDVFCGLWSEQGDELQVEAYSQT